MDPAEDGPPPLDDEDGPPPLEDAPPKKTLAAFDLAIEATGNNEVLQRLLPMLRPRGTVVMKTTTESPITADLSLVVVNELRLVGSRCGSFADALAAIAGDRVPVERWIAARYPLAQGPAAFCRAARPDSLKVLIEMSSTGSDPID